MNVDSLFVYGTLLPGQSRWHHLRPWVTDSGTPDALAADLYDTGLGYPAIIPGGDKRYDGGTTVGTVFTLAGSTLDAALAHLDEVEGAVGGLYHREIVTTSAGREVFVYCYGDGLNLQPIRSGSWLTHSPGTDV